MSSAKGRSGQGPAGLPWPEISQGEPGPLYGVFGEEDFLVNQGLEAFCAAPAFSDNPSLNIEQFHAEDAKPSQILESARTLPFLGRRRLIIVRGADQYKAAQLAEFLDYLGDAPSSTCLVFAGAKLDSRTKFAKTLQKQGKVHVYKKMYPNQLPPWLNQRASARGKKLAPQAAQHLSEMAGLGLGALDSELEKLSLFVGRRAEITMDDVAKVVGSGRLNTIFDLTDAIARCDLHRSLTAFEQLYALGEAPVRVVAMLQRLIRQVLEVRAIMDSGGDQRQVQQQLRTPPQATAALMTRARRESSAGLSSRLARLLRADMDLKSSPGTDRVIVERLIMDLCLISRQDGPGPGGRNLAR